VAVDRWGQQHGKTVHWLLDVTFAGRVFRFAQSELDVDDDDNATTYHYDDGIVGELVYKREWDFGSDTISMNTVSLELLFPVDVAELVAQGHDLAAATGELSRWVEGTDYADRKTMLVGIVRDPEYGEEGVPVRCSLEENFFDDAGTIPDLAAVVNASTTWATQLDAADLELPYPVIIGRPGRVADADDGRISGSQALWWYKFGTSQAAVLVADGHVLSDYVTLANDAFPAGLLFLIEKTFDGLGRPVSIIPGGDPATVETTVGSETVYLGICGTGGAIPNLDNFQPGSGESPSTFAAWYDPIAADAGEDYGGAQAEGKAVRDAGDVLEYVLGFSSMRIDRNALNAIKPRIAQFKIDCVIDARVKPWEWIRDNLLPILPISVVAGPQGISCVYWDYAATAEDAVATIDGDVDVGVELGEHISYDSSKVANKWDIKYAKSLRTDSWTKSIDTENAGLGLASVVLTEQVLNADNLAQIALLANQAGMDGWQVRFWSDAAGPTYVDEPEIRRLSVGFLNVGTNATTLVDGINANSSYVTARLLVGDTGNVFAGAAEEQTVTLRSRAGSQPTVSRFAYLSRERYKSVVNPTGILAKTLELPQVYDEATAWAILGWMEQAFAFAHRTIEALLPEHAWDFLERGNVVLLRKTSLHLVDQVALVQAIEHSDDGFLAVRFLLIENPDRDDRYDT